MMGVSALFDQIMRQQVDLSMQATEEVFMVALMVVIVGWVLGTLPAFFTGKILTHQCYSFGVIKPFLIGAVISGLLAWLVLALTVFDPDWKSLCWFILLAGVVGGISTLIIGYFVLPKTNSNES